jgi:hypothetical protein
MAGYSKLYNIEMDPHEDFVIGGMCGWVSEPALKTVEEFLASVKKFPNPAAPKADEYVCLRTKWHPMSALRG